MKSVVDREVVRLRGHDGAAETENDVVAVEEPLEIRVAGDPVAITMRTPGDDARLALGFLFAEGVVRGVEDVGTIAHCGRPGDEGFGNVIDVLPGPGVVLVEERVGATRRGTLTTSSCGVCGRRSIDDLLERCASFEPGPFVGAAAIREAIESLRTAQPTFTKTGGVHAAAAITADGTLLATAEDVGRHNAVDKVVGTLVQSRKIRARDEKGSDPFSTILAVSGRASFEIVQKAAVARIPIVAAVSAPSSLAVDLAARLGMTLVGFVRGGGMVVYAGRERVT